MEIITASKHIQEYNTFYFGRFPKKLSINPLTSASIIITVFRVYLGGIHQIVQHHLSDYVVRDHLDLIGKNHQQHHRVDELVTSVEEVKLQGLLTMPSPTGG
jgi:hypothetical protein